MSKRGTKQPREELHPFHAALLSPESINSLPLAAAIVRVTQLGNGMMKRAEEELAELRSQGHRFPYGHVAIYGAKAETLDAVLMLMSNNTLPLIFVPQYNRMVERLEMPNMRMEAA